MEMEQPGGSGGDGSGGGRGSGLTPQKSQEKSLTNRNDSVRSVLASRLEGFSFKNADCNMDQSDEVFNQAQHSCGPSGGHGAFPPAYGVIRAAKGANLMAGTFNGLGDMTREPTPTGYPKTGFIAGSDNRPFAAQNYHCAEKGLNISLSVKRRQP